MTHASVFSGIGGPEVAATMLGWDNLFHCEINPFCRKILNYWYPYSKSYEDITKTDFSEWQGKVNVLSGGFPCQPFSYAGQRRGSEDDRYLWPSMFRCIDQVKPDWVVAENVAGILTMVEQGEVSEMESSADLFGKGDRLRRYRLRETFTFQRICNDLESHGYSVQPILIPSCAVGAPHRRDRVFIIGHTHTHADSASDTNHCADGRDTREDAFKGKEKRIQEWDEIWKLDESNQVRPACDGKAFTDSYISGEGTPREGGSFEGNWCNEDKQQGEWGAETEWSDRFYEILRHASNTNDKRLERGDKSRCCKRREWLPLRRYFTRLRYERGEEICGERWASFPSVSPVHRGNDGLPFDVDNLTISFGKWRTESLKAYGNAIVPQVIYEIFRFIEQVELLQR